MDSSSHQTPVWSFDRIQEKTKIETSLAWLSFTPDGGKPPPAAAPSTMAVRRLDRRSELGRQVAVDFETDADLEKGWGRPCHGRSLFILVHRQTP
jgi:hypothetical protein